MLWCSQFMPIMLHKYAIMLLSKIIFCHKNTFSHRTVIKHIKRLQNSRIEAKCHWLVTLIVLQHQRCARSKATRQATSNYNQARCIRPFFPIESRGNCACTIHMGLKNNRIMPALCSMLWRVICWCNIRTPSSRSGCHGNLILHFVFSNAPNHPARALPSRLAQPPRLPRHLAWLH